MPTISNSAQINRIPVLISIINRDLEFIYANNSYSEFYSRGSGSIVGKKLLTVLGEAIYKELLPHLEKALKGEASVSKHVRDLISGEQLVLESTFEPFVVNNEITGVVTTTTELEPDSEPGPVRQRRLLDEPTSFDYSKDLLLKIDLDGRIVESISEDKPPVSENGKHMNLAAVNAGIGSLPGRFRTEGLGFEHFHKTKSIGYNEPFLQKPAFSPGQSITEVLPEPVSRWVLTQLRQLKPSMPITEYEYFVIENGLEAHYEIRLITNNAKEALLVIKNITDRKDTEKLQKLQVNLAAGLTQQHDLDHSLRFIIKTLMKIEGIDCGGIYLIEPENQSLVLKAHLGVSMDFAQMVDSFLPDSQQYQIAMNKQPVYRKYDSTFIPDRNNDDRDEILSIGAIPLTKQDKVIGIINVGSRKLQNIPDKIKIQIESLVKIVGFALGKFLAEQTLLNNQQDFKRLFDTLDDYLFILDEQGNIIMTNRVVEEQLKYTREELCGMNVLNVHPAERREEAGTIVIKMLKGEAKFCPVPLLSHDGREIPVETRVVKGIWDKKEVLFGISRDITERKISEKALINKTEELETFFDVALDLLCISNPTGRFVKVNRAWEDILGFTSEELQQKEFFEFVHPDDIEPTIAMLSVLNQKSPVSDFTNRYKTKHGDYRFIEWRSVPVGGLIYSAARDITAHKQLEISLWDSIHKEKELNDLKSRFVSMASHEFRTPLTSILMSAETLSAYWTRLNSNQIDTMIGNIKEQISHLTNIVSKVMLLSKGHEGKLQVQLTETDMVSLVTKTINKFNESPDLSQKITFTSRYNTLAAQTDEFLIVQVLNNLIANALKYSQPKPIVDLKLTTQKSTIRIQIRDNGMGIDQNDQPHLFEPFFRGLNAMTEQGTGLGLTIVQESVKLLGGTISFSSKKGEGTLFTVELPIAYAS